MDLKYPLTAVSGITYRFRARFRMDLKYPLTAVSGISIFGLRRR